MKIQTAHLADTTCQYGPAVNNKRSFTETQQTKSLHYLAIVTSHPIKPSHNLLLNLCEFVKWSRKRNSMRKIDTNNDIFLAAMLRSGGIPRTGSAYTGFTHSMALDRNFSIYMKLMWSWIQSLLLSNKMNDFICQTSNKTYPHVSTVKLDVSISCGTPDLDAHADKMGNPVVVFAWLWPADGVVCCQLSTTTTSKTSSASSWRLDKKTTQVSRRLAQYCNRLYL